MLQLFPKCLALLRPLMPGQCCVGTAQGPFPQGQEYFVQGAEGSCLGQDWGAWGRRSLEEPR